VAAGPLCTGRFDVPATARVLDNVPVVAVHADLLVAGRTGRPLFEATTSTLHPLGEVLMLEYTGRVARDLDQPIR
jgi:hypothetical protein